MPSTGIGVYPGSATAVENNEVSSTYEGRHLTFLASDITGQEHALVTKGHPVVIGEHIVGVAFKTEVLGSDLIAIDTEGIWNLMVYAKDDLGNIAVVAGDELYINKTNAEISKIRNANTHTRFGYALGSIASGYNYVIAVKVHWDPADEMEVVGASGTPFVSTQASRTFREYYYQATGGGYITGETFDLVIPNTAARTFVTCAQKIGVTIPGDAWICTGYSTALELKFLCTAGSERPGTSCCLVMDWNNLNTDPTTNWVTTYVLLRDHVEDNTTSCIRKLFHFADHDALDDGGVTKGNSVIQDTNTPLTNNVAIQCSYGVGNDRFWIMGSTTVPD